MHVPISALAAHVYTECARIWNPVHTDTAVADRAGLPGLILHGTADTEIPFAEAEYLHAGLPTSSLIPFVGGGHSILATHAEPYRQAIIDFLQSRALAPSAAV